jgi:hypothetical protein
MPGQRIGTFSGAIDPPETMKAMASFLVQSSQTSREVGTISTKPEVGLGVVGT